MNHLEIKQHTSELVRDMVRKEGLVHTADVMNLIPLLMSCVRIDTAGVRQKIEAELNKKTANPINALLGLLGLRIVNTKHVMRSAGLGDTAEPVTLGCVNGTVLESMLMLEETQFRTDGVKIVQRLKDYENQQTSDRLADREHNGRLHRKLDEKTEECERLQADLQGQTQMVAAQCQYVLSLIGQENMEQPVAKQLLEMLSAMGIRVYWTAEEAPFPDHAMFKALPSRSPDQERRMPCMAEENRVLELGVRFTAAE